MAAAEAVWVRAAQSMSIRALLQSRAAPSRPMERLVGTADQVGVPEVGVRQGTAEAGEDYRETAVMDVPEAAAAHVVMAAKVLRAMVAPPVVVVAERFLRVGLAKRVRKVGLVAPAGFSVVGMVATSQTTAMMVVTVAAVELAVVKIVTSFLA